MSDDLIDAVSKSLRNAWHLGQTYWRQADSESYVQNRKSDETHKKFETLIEETRLFIISATAPRFDNEPAPQGVAEMMQLVERYAESCSNPNPYGWKVKEIPKRWDAVNRAITAIVQERDALKAREAELEGDVARDAARYRWLTADLTGAAKYLRNELLDRMSVMSYSSACTDIDAAIAASKEAP